jgi:uncharacterized protein YxeA
MTKKTALTILILIIIAAILFVGLFLFFQKQTDQKNPAIEAARNFFGGFFPTGDNNNSNNPENNTNNKTNNEEGQNSNTVIPKLRQVSSFPVAGGVMFEKTSTTSSLLIQEGTGAEQNQKITEVVYRFVERVTGHVYETTSRNLSQKRITNTTIPKIYRVFFSSDGESLAMTFLNDQTIETILTKITYPTASTSTNETAVDENFANIKINFVLNESFGFTQNKNNDYAFFKKTYNDSEALAATPSVTNLYAGNLKTPTVNKNISDLKTSEWKIQILKDGTLAINTKPSFLAEGFLYFLNPKDGILKKKLGNTPGLSSLVSPDGKKILYSYYNSGDTKMAIYDSDKKVYSTLSLSTIVGEKCVWGEKNSTFIFCAIPNNIVRGNFPDVWYQGKFSFNDSFVKINTSDLTYSKVMTANSETKINIDAIDLQLSPSEDYLMFTNKNDLILWSLDIL